MRRMLLPAAVMAILLVAMPAASASAPAVLITGGGTSYNSLLGPDVTRTIGFVAAESVDGSVKGQVQVKNVSDLNGETLSQLHGEVVCISETSGVADGDGWEIRFRVTKSAGGFLNPQPGQYVSVYVQDLESGDMIDDVDSLGTRTNPACGLNDGLVEWDDVINGDIKARS